MKKITHTITFKTEPGLELRRDLANLGVGVKIDKDHYQTVEKQMTKIIEEVRKSTRNKLLVERAIKFQRG